MMESSLWSHDWSRARAGVLPICCALLQIPLCVRAQEFVEFSEITAEAGIASYGTTFGVALEDLDGDGHVDLFLARTPSMLTEHMALGGSNRLFLNHGDATFVEVGAEAGVASACENRGLMVADLDNDGDIDLYVTVAGRNELYRNEGDATFTERGAAAGVDHWGIGHEGAWLDYDGDGWLDVYFTNGPKEGSLANVLYRNERNGRFRDVSDEAGVTGTVSGKGVALIDYDRDSWLDLVVTNGNDYANFLLFHNQGDGTFVESAGEAGLEVEVEETFLSWLIPWDYDNDGWQDLLVGSHSGYYPRNTLFHNQGDGTFEDVTDQVGIRDPFNGDGTAVVDLDNDGWLDALFCRLDDECVLYRNVEGEEFELVDGGAGLLNQAEYPNWTISTGDVDGDGFQDVYMGNGRANHPAHDHLFLNDGNDNHHLFVKVEGATGDRSAIGARVEVVAGDLVQTRWVGSRLTTFSSHGGLRLHFGLADHDTVDEVRVVFPDGDEVVIEDVDVDDEVLVSQPAGNLTDGDRDGVPDVADPCPWTPTLTLTDARGCAPFEGGDGTEMMTLSGPQDGAVATDDLAFTWSGTLDGYVVQIDSDTSFDHDRMEFGPVTVQELEMTAATTAEAQSRYGTGRLFWRVLGSTDEVTVVSPPRELNLPEEATSVTLLHDDLNIWDPPHVRVEVGDTVRWRIPGEDEGNYNKFRHDVLLTDEDGYVIGRSGLLRPFVGDDEYAFTFDQPGLYYMMCAMHSWPSEEAVDLEQLVGGWIDPGPYRCHSGSVTVEEP